MALSDPYIEPNLDISNLDNFFIRSSIFEALKRNLSCFSGRMIDVGCGRMPYKEFILQNSNVVDYIGLDLENANSYSLETKPDVLWDGYKIPLESDLFDCAIATEVLEHCPEPEIVLKEIYRVLKPGGILFFSVPFLWNLHEVPHDEYRYTPFSLKRHLRNSGFEDIEIKASGGWDASLAQMLGLWLKRSGISSYKSKLLSIILKPIIKRLIDNDKAKTVEFTEGQMISGLYGLVKK